VPIGLLFAIYRIENRVPNVEQFEINWGTLAVLGKIKLINK
jgi:hypothetical protein